MKKIFSTKKRQVVLRYRAFDLLLEAGAIKDTGSFYRHKVTFRGIIPVFRSVESTIEINC